MYTKILHCNSKCNPIVTENMNYFKVCHFSLHFALAIFVCYADLNNLWYSLGFWSCQIILTQADSYPQNCCQPIWNFCTHFYLNSNDRVVIFRDIVPAGLVFFFHPTLWRIISFPSFFFTCRGSRATPRKKIKLLSDAYFRVKMENVYLWIGVFWIYLLGILYFSGVVPVFDIPINVPDLAAEICDNAKLYCPKVGQFI